MDDPDDGGRLLAPEVGSFPLPGSSSSRRRVTGELSLGAPRE